MKPIRFLWVLIILGALLHLVYGQVIQLGEYSTPSLFKEIILLNVLVTFFIYRLLFKISSPQVFVNAYLTSIVVKLLFYSGLLLTIRLVLPQALNPNAILILVCYLIFTAAEVTFLFLKAGK